MTAAEASAWREQANSARRGVGSAYGWWIALYAASLFLPPIPLTFTPTAHSKLLAGAIVAAAYLIWRPIFCRVGIFNFSNLRRLLPLAVTFYMSAHAVYAALRGNTIGALIEAQWLIYLAVPLMMTWDLGPLQDSRIVRALLACLGVEALLAVISSFTGPMYEYVVLWYGPRFGTNVYRAVGTTDSTNSLGGLMAFGALVCMFAPIRTLPFRRSLLLAGFLAAVVLSQSKSAYFAVLISLTVVGVLSMRWRIMSGGRWLRTAGFQAFALSAFAVVFYLYGDAVLDNLTQDYGDRTALSERVIAEVMKFDWPQWLFGVGFHGVDYINPSTGAWITAHDSYVNLVADLGACGTVLVLSLLGVLAATLLKDRQWHLLAGLFGLLLHFVTEAFLYAPLFVMTVGTLYGISCVHRRAPERVTARTRPREISELGPHVIARAL